MLMWGQRTPYRVERRLSVSWSEISAGPIDFGLVREADRKHPFAKPSAFFEHVASSPLFEPGALPPPLLERRFAANGFEMGTPNDNTLAISPAGEILSAVNTAVAVYDTTGRRKERKTLTDFGDTLQLPGREFDPRVLYDPLHRRFVMVFLSGSHSSNSRLIVGFAGDDSATGMWHFYALPGDPLGDSSWTDFPMVALWDSTLVVTVNLLWNDSSWQAGFRQTIIWQIPTAGGYQGADSLDAYLTAGIGYGGRPLRNLCPVIPYRRPPTDSFFYFLSNRNFSPGNDTFFLVRLSPSGAWDVRPVISDVPYAMPPDAQMRGTQSLATNDARVLWAGQWDSAIYFTGNTRSPSGKASVYAGRMVGSAAVLRILPTDVHEWGYPSAAPFGNGRWLLFTNYAGDTSMPGCGAFVWEDTLISTFRILQRGFSPVNLLQGSTERWGDYTTCQPDPTDSHRIWCAGYVGRRVRVGMFSYNGHVTWVGAFRQGQWPAAVPRPPMTASLPRIFPSPAQTVVVADLVVEQGGMHRVDILDPAGRVIHEVWEDVLRPGRYRMQWRVADWPAGRYVLRVSGPDGIRTIPWTKR